MLDVALFGHLRLSIDGKQIRFAARPRVAPLLAYLLLNRHQPVLRDTVAFALWPDDCEQVARANLRRHLHYMRELLPPVRTPWLISDAHAVRWNPAAPLRLDVAEFEECAADPAAMERAVGLYAELLPGYDDEWLIEARERFRRTFVATLWEVARRARSRRDCVGAAQYLERILADDPWREDALRALMSVRCEAGDRSSALQLCLQFEQRLRDEMGVALMPETIALRHAIERDGPLPAIPLGPTPRAAPTAFSDLPFEGRNAEISRLRELWQNVVGGSGAFALVVGEAGIGKTRLASELALHVESNGGRVLWGATSAPETAPYQAITEVLRAALTFIEALHLDAYDLMLLSRLIPELRPQEQLSEINDSAVAKLFDLIAAVLGEIAGQRPALVVLEDLHNAGPASIAMVQHIVDPGLHHPIMLLTTSRAEESRSSEALARLRRPLRGSKTFVIPLGTLSEEAVASILAQSLGPSGVASRVGALSGGHPLFLAELLYAASDSQGLATESLPARLHDIITERTSRLTPEARLLLRAAAVVGNSFDLEIVGELVGWSEDRLADAADELVSRRVVRQTANSRSFEYEFSHDLIASATYASLTERARRRWHRRTAHAAERWYGARVDELSAFIARHFEFGGERERAAEYYLCTARTAAAAFANEEALTYARRALALLPASLHRDRFELLSIVEEVLDRSGERSGQRSTLRDMSQIASQLRDPERMREVLRREETLYRYTGEIAAARRVTERLCRLASGDARWEAIALRDKATLLNNSGSQAEAYRLISLAAKRAVAANDATVLVPTLTLQAHIGATMGLQAQAQECLCRAKAAAEATNSITLLIRVLYCEMTVLTRFAAWASVAESAPKLLSLAEKIGSSEVAAGAHLMMGSALGELFRVEDARRHVGAAIEAYRHGNRIGLLIAYNNLASIELEVGRVDHAAQALAEVEAVIAEHDSIYGRVLAAVINCELAAQRADNVRTIELADEAIAIARERADEMFEAEALRCKGVTHRQTGRPAEAIPMLERAVEIYQRLRLDGARKRATAELGLACALAGDRRAGSLADNIIELCERETAETDSPLLLWPLAQALNALGRTVQAEVMLCRAFDAFQRRRRRLRGRRDRQAFSATVSNAALQLAYASARARVLGKSANEESPQVRQVPKTQTADGSRPPAHSL